MRPAVHAVYGFVRTADEIVDGADRPVSAQQRLRELDQLEEELGLARAGGSVQTPAVMALVDAAQRHNLPLDELGPYLNSMRRDVQPLRITDWADLESYMEGSAGSVGRIMAPLLGAPAWARGSFARLGLAFQLTNFIRDFQEDLSLGRVYLPADELAQAGVGDDGLAAIPACDGLRSVVERQVVRARDLFAEGLDGARAVTPTVRRGIGFARAIYVRTLDRVEALGFDVTGRKLSLPPIALASAALRGLKGDL
jgi:phytoene synthase